LIRGQILSMKIAKPEAMRILLSIFMGWEILL
jgi:hypothetical protein